MSLISLQHITKTFQSGESDFHALDDISLDIQSGEFVAVMGPSGSGKSTLMNIIGLLDRPSRGSYTLNGQSVSLTMSDGEQAKLRSEVIGFIFQNFNLLANVDVFANVLLPNSYLRRPNGKAKEQAMALLKQVGLEYRVHHKIPKLSGGERQRVAIARALMNSPKVILADEPTGNLDSKSGDEVMKILMDLNASGTTLVMVTHSEELAAKANRIIRIKDGHIVAHA